MERSTGPFSLSFSMLWGAEFHPFAAPFERRDDNAIQAERSM